MATIVEYIWIDGTTPTSHLRSKTRVIPEIQDLQVNPEMFPAWSFDGSSTNQADSDRSDCILRPVFVKRDPVRGRNAYLVLCEVFSSDGTPHPTNKRAVLRHLLDDGGTELKALFGLEQEYTLFQGSSPLGFPSERRFPPAQGPYYCGVGADEVYGRSMVEEHLRACLEARLCVSGINAEVMPGQWEFQIGPLGPLDVGDHIWLARWLLYRIGENHGITAILDAKPVPGDWNGAGMHANFSTEAMRAPTGGREAIEMWCQTAEKHVPEHLAAYGDGIEMRLTGKHETCRWDQFRWGVSDRTASIRIPLQAEIEGRGYLEDRRPNACADPYRIAEVMIRTALNRW